MPRYVIDSNVAVKWTVMEENWQQARRLLEADDQDLIAPVTLLPEALNALVQKHRRHELPVELVLGAMPTLLASISYYPLAPLCEPALELSLRLTITIHDAVFLALALRDRSPLVTADLRLINAAGPHFPETIVALSSLPAI